ncbi:MAG: alpha-L-fucosidase [Planctomycetes bacterium]|nr:alpha-L-fucosidase [Planctomycetota bacterium]
MNRREFLLTSAAAGMTWGCRGPTTAARQVPGLPVPRPAQLAWQQAGFGIVFHYDLHLFDDVRYVQARNRREPPEDPGIFDPTALDTDQWLAAAAAAGARFAILTASHETGFRLGAVGREPVLGGEHPVARRARRPGRRVRRVLPAARHRARHLPRGTLERPAAGAGLPRAAGSPLTQEAYNRLIEREVEEICTHYGPLFELWFDGGILTPQDGGPDVLPIFERHQPDCLYYHSDQRADARWGGTESGSVGDPCWATIDLAAARSKVWDAAKRELLSHGDPDGADWCPAMADAPLRNHEWFWEPDDEHKLYPLEQLVEMYFASVGRNATLILGATPDRRGLVPDADFERLRELGRAVRAALGEPVASRAAEGSELVLDVPGDRPFDVVVLREDIRYGERVRQYVVEARLTGDTWNPIASGTCIGHQRIHRLPATRGPQVRVRIERATATPLLRSFELRRSVS